MHSLRACVHTAPHTNCSYPLIKQHSGLPIYLLQLLLGAAGGVEQQTAPRPAHHISNWVTHRGRVGTYCTYWGNASRSLIQKPIRTLQDKLCCQGHKKTSVSRTHRHRYGAGLCLLDTFCFTYTTTLNEMSPHTDTHTHSRSVQRQTDLVPPAA